MYNATFVCMILNATSSLPTDVSVPDANLASEGGDFTSSDLQRAPAQDILDQHVAQVPSVGVAQGPVMGERKLRRCRLHKGNMFIFLAHFDIVV